MATSLHVLLSETACRAAGTRGRRAITTRDSRTNTHVSYTPAPSLGSLPGIPCAGAPAAGGRARGAGQLRGNCCHFSSRAEVARAQLAQL